MKQHQLKIAGFLSILMLTLLAGRAQNLNKARHLKVERVGDLRSLGSDFFCYENGRNFGDNSQVLRFDSLGNILKSIKFTMGQTNEIKALKIAMDGDLIYLGMARPDCPIVAMAQYSYALVKVDTSGNQKFMTLLNAINPNMYYFFDLTQLADSSFVVSNGPQVTKVSKDGSTQSSSNIGPYSIYSLEALPNGNMLAATGVGLKELTPQLSTVFQNNTTVVSMKRFANGKIVVYNGAQQFSILNSNLSSYTVNATALPAGYVYSTYFDVDSNKVLVCSQDAANNMLYAVYDQNLSLLHLTSTNDGNPAPYGIAVNNSGRVMVIANNGFPVSLSKTYASRFTFPLFGAYQMSNDVGIEAVQPKALSTISVNPYNTWVAADFDITVKNYSVDTLKSVKLNLYYLVDSCTELVNGVRYNLNLAPGQSTVLSTGWSSVYPVHYPAEFGQPFNVNICWFTTIPNDANDINLANDKFCVPVSGIVSEPELTADRSFLTFYPNPVCDKLQLPALEAGELRVYNNLGQNIHTLDKPSGELSLDCSSWRPGLYLMELRSGTKVLRAKVLRE